MKNNRTAPKQGARKRPHARPVAGALLWTRDISGRCARTVAIGSNRLLVENHTGILELTEGCIRLGTRCGPITVTGEGLSLCEARRGCVIILGTLHGIELPPEGGAGPNEG